MKMCEKFEKEFARVKKQVVDEVVDELAETVEEGSILYGTRKRKVK